MISVIIPTLNAEATLAGTLEALVPAAVTGLVREVLVVDGGSSDLTADIVEHAGANLVQASLGRGHQLKSGAARARFPWLLFLHADTVLASGWEHEAGAFMRGIDRQELPLAAAAFRFALDDKGARARVLERAVALRCATLRVPYGDQGLLIPKRLYEEIGGYRPLALMEDVDLVRRLGRGRVVLLRTQAVTSAERFRREGYVRRGARNLVCLALWALRVPIHVIARIYG
jgi:rSAM/selenodomain-associated transferase 2